MHNEPIVTDPAILMGRPVIAGTRVAVDELLDRLAEETLPDGFDGVAPEGVRAALRFAAEAIRAASPVEGYAPLELHGLHPVAISNSVNGADAAIAVRTFEPGAAAVSVERIPSGPSGKEPHGTPVRQPMQRVHRDGIFEALFRGETEPFQYRLAITSPGGEIRIAEVPYSLPPYFDEGDFPSLANPISVAREGTFEEPFDRLDEKLGAHSTIHGGLAGVVFAVWAPRAAGVSLVGDFNAWDGLRHPMRLVGGSGVWELFVPGLVPGQRYKYRIQAREGGKVDKADPYAFAAELRPGKASVVYDLDRYEWRDAAWLSQQARRQALDRPIAIYEVHLGSWRRSERQAPGGGPRGWLSYRELAERLIPYVTEMGYTHIELMPLAEHPFDGSWGYQVTGCFAPTSRYGAPDDFRHFVDAAHAAGLGIVLDWVPGHFPKDEHGLALFDGAPLYEHADPRRSENLEWGTSSFNLERPEVRAFLLSNALFWIERFHIDALRVDAVSSMIYLDYSRRHWVPNEHGGRENLAAAAFLRSLNARIHADHPGVFTIAEESTAWPRVTGREGAQSLGFDLKWNLGWMNDTLTYAGRDPVHRRFHHKDLTFSLVYAFNENFLLPFSHDEVVHGKRSLLSKMPGTDGQQFANLRLLYGYLYAHPGKKLQFMGGEFGQRREWDHDCELEWPLLALEPHRQLKVFVRDLNHLYVSQPALHEVDSDWKGFQWIDCDDAERSILTFVRRGKAPDEAIVVAANFTPVAREGYRLDVPAAEAYLEVLNSDARKYGGGDARNRGRLATEPAAAGGGPSSLLVTLPPLGIVFFSASGSGAGHREGNGGQTPA